MKKILALLIGCTAVAGAEPLKTIFNPFTGKLDYITTLSSGTLPSGSTQYIRNAATLQSGATFYVSSGTVDQSFYVNGTNQTGTTPLFQVATSTLNVLANGSTILGSGTGSTTVLNRLGVYSTAGADGGFSVRFTDGSEWFGVGGIGAGLVSFNAQGGQAFCGSPGDLGGRMNIGSLTGGTIALAITGTSGQSAKIMTVNTVGNTSGDVISVSAGALVGIGATNPGYKLHLSSGTFAIDGNVSPAIQIKGTGAPPDSQALCLLAGQLGHCTSVVNVGGGCTCSVP